jgi:very-short-patch-repair endonuclease
VKAGRNDLAIAISRHGGGWPTMAHRLALELTQMPKDHWTDVENVRSALVAVNERRGRPGEMPTKTDLDLAGEFSLGAAIEKLGGYPAIAAMFGLSAGRISLSPRSRDELILAHELKLFMDIDLEAHKITTTGGKRDVDIIVRPLQLVIEYDSHHFHRDGIERDSRKTEDLQDGGWRVIRVREEPLERLQPTDLICRKGRHKETSNRVLLRLQEMQAVQPQAVDQYLRQPELQNIGACELYIAHILRTKRGEVIEE